MDLAAEMERITGIAWKDNKRLLSASLPASLTDEQKEKAVEAFSAAVSSQVLVIKGNADLQDGQIKINNEYAKDIIERFHQLEKSDKAKGTYRAAEFSNELKAAITSGTSASQVEISSDLKNALVQWLDGYMPNSLAYETPNSPRNPIPKTPERKI